MASRLLTQVGAAALGVVAGATVVVIIAWWSPGGEKTDVEPPEAAGTAVDDSGASQVSGVPGQFTEERINAMSVDEAREAIKMVALARVHARTSGDSELEARLKHEFELLMGRLREESHPENGSDR